MRRLRGRRVAAVTGERGWFGSVPARREEVLRAFAPRAQGASLPALALETNVLIATDLLSEGLNLQDVGLEREGRSEEHTSELQSLAYIVCRLMLEKKRSARILGCLFALSV